MAAAALSWLLALAAGGGLPGPERSAALEGRVRFLGPAPRPRALVIPAGTGCGHAGTLSAEDVVVSAGGLANAFVTLERGVEPGRVPPPDGEPVVLRQEGCVFRPHVVGVRAGTVLAVENADGVAHNVHVVARRNPQSNVTQAAGAEPLALAFERRELGVAVRCDLHPWMQAWVCVEEHPWFAVSGADGAYAIEGVPPGRYVAQLWHEVYGSQRMEVELAAGERVQLDFEVGGDERAPTAEGARPAAIEAAGTVGLPPLALSLFRALHVLAAALWMGLVGAAAATGRDGPTLRLWTRAASAAAVLAGAVLLFALYYAEGAPPQFYAGGRPAPETGTWALLLAGMFVAGEGLDVARAWAARRGRPALAEGVLAAWLALAVAAGQHLVRDGLSARAATLHLGVLLAGAMATHAWRRGRGGPGDAARRRCEALLAGPVVLSMVAVHEPAVLGVEPWGLIAAAILAVGLGATGSLLVLAGRRGAA